MFFFYTCVLFKRIFRPSISDEIYYECIFFYFIFLVHASAVTTLYLLTGVNNLFDIIYYTSLSLRVYKLLIYLFYTTRAPLFNRSVSRTFITQLDGWNNILLTSYTRYINNELHNVKLSRFRRCFIVHSRNWKSKYFYYFWIYLYCGWITQAKILFNFSFRYFYDDWLRSIKNIFLLFLFSIKKMIK